MNTVEVKSLSKYYGSTCGVEALNFAVEEGEVFGYLGPNGSGKTTTIRCLMGLLRPTHGECRILGERVMTGRATRHEQVGYLPGEFRIWPELTARKSLDLLGALNGNTNTASRAEELATRLELDLDRPVGNLSKGNRQKVGVIYAFQHNPKILILDEPTSGLDPLVRQTILDLIREAADCKTTVLLSSHDLNEVAAVCGRAAILRKGQLIEVAPISEIVRQGERRLKVWFAEGARIPSFPSDKFPGVRLIHQETELLDLAYHGTVDEILKWLSQFPVDRIETPQTSLEEAFIQYYKNPSNRDDGPTEDSTESGDI